MSACKEQDKTMDKAVNIALAIETDICDRAGLGNGWDEIDDDIRQEIREEWQQIIQKELNRE